MKHPFMKISSYILAAFLLLAGVAHFRAPDTFDPLFFDFVPEDVRLIIIYLSGAAEIILALGLLTLKFREQSALLIFWMFVLYLPLHVRDIFIENPVVGSQTVAIVRLIMQFGLLYWVWAIRKATKKAKREGY